MRSSSSASSSSTLLILPTNELFPPSPHSAVPHLAHLRIALPFLGRVRCPWTYIAADVDIAWRYRAERRADICLTLIGKCFDLLPHSPLLFSHVWLSERVNEPAESSPPVHEYSMYTNRLLRLFFSPVSLCSFSFFSFIFFVAFSRSLSYRDPLLFFLFEMRRNIDTKHCA